MPPDSSCASPVFASASRPAHATGALVLADGAVFWGKGLGAAGQAVGEICFNTSMTGYQEILTDPSYAGQIVNFTFPHIGNTGANIEDIEATNPFARGLIVAEDITAASNWRAAKPFEAWLCEWNLTGLCGIDTRQLTRHIRDRGAPGGVIIHAPDGQIDVETLAQQAREWPGLDGMDLAREVSCRQMYRWSEGLWRMPGEAVPSEPARYRVVAIDYGAKRNILRALASAGCEVIVVPAETSAEDILRHQPDGIFLSNGPGDPAATGVYAVPAIQALIASGKPVFGICLGHQLLALAMGGTTRKMAMGHRGGNQPVKDLTTGKVEITSQNHGFEVLADTLPDRCEVTHVSLFDGSNEGLRLKDRPVFSVQYHPEASPGPHDSQHLFRRFAAAMEACR